MMRSANDQLVRAVDLLRKLKPNGSNGQADLQQCEFNELIKNALDVVRKRSSLSTVDLNCVLAEQPVFIYAHETKLTQAIVNVLQNAIDAGHSESDRASVVTVRLTVSSTVATLRIHNDGPPLTDHALDRLFDPFFTTKSQGTGLGLAISRRVIEQHGGGVRLFNAERGGVTCEMVLPVAKENGDV
jgi:signal transduction histidine kinase